MKKIFFISCLGAASLFLGMSPNIGQKIEWQVPASIKEFLAEDDNVQLSIKALTKEESEKYLRKDLLDLGYQPIEVMIENASPDPYLFSPESVALPLVDAKKIAKRILYKSIPRSIGFRIASFFFWPMTIPGTIDTVLTNKSYRKLKKQLQSRSIKEEIIAPYSTVHRVFFVLIEDSESAFTITLENQETLQSKVFQVEELSNGNRQTAEALPTVLENYYLSHE